ncbi:MAG: response regulator [Pseudomonadota bacterium]
MTDTPKGRLLIVDDEVSLMVALRATLRDEGYQVEGFTSGAEALAALQPGGFDAVLADLMMPKMDGITLLRQALAIDPHLAGIVMTGHGSIPTAVEAMKVGAVDYVLKPFKLSAMLPVLERGITIRRLRVKNAELEARVRERTAELETANQELEAFCHSVSHDLRTPLRTITGFAEIMRDYHSQALPPDIRRFVELIHAGAGEMSQLINDLLALSRLGRHALSRKTIDLEHLCREVFKDLAGERGNRRVDLRVQTLSTASADPGLLRLALTNLLSNAQKYTGPRDHALIEVGVTRPVEGRVPVYFVRDNGVGFDMRDADKLFKVFQRLHHAHEFPGTGVGLATVRRIIERHGGRIWAEAVPGSGATFFFTLSAESGLK